MESRPAEDHWARSRRVASVSGCSWPRTRSCPGNSAISWSWAGAVSPAAPVRRARLRRADSVSGCSAPTTRPRTGTRAANLSRALAASPAMPVQQATVRCAVKVLGCSGPGTPGAAATEPQAAPARQSGRRPRRSSRRFRRKRSTRSAWDVSAWLLARTAGCSPMRSRVRGLRCLREHPGGCFWQVGGGCRPPFPGGGCPAGPG